MKRYLLLFILFSLFQNFIFSDMLHLPFNFITSEEPIKWYPEEGVYENNINLFLKSEDGKIYYLINSTLGVTEPLEYKDAILLKGRPYDIVDYNVTAFLYKNNGKVECYTRFYRIDMTKKLKKEDFKKIDYLKKSFKKIIDDTTGKEKLIANFSFISKKYNVTFNKNLITFPVSVVENEKNSKEIIIERDENKNTIYVFSSSYEKDGKIFTEIDAYSFHIKKVYPPSFGSLHWGQIYRQGYKIKIKPYSTNDIVYYWLREWDSKDLILGPPTQARLDLWNAYNSPIELVSKYGKDGIFGIAAFSMDKEGNFSEIRGPFYFKITDVDGTLEQVFENGYNQQKINENKIFINGVLLDNKSPTFYGEVTLTFQNQDPKNSFYFLFNQNFNEGKSSLLPMIGNYKFENSDLNPVIIDIYSSSHEKIGSFVLCSKNMLLPVAKKYSGNYIVLNKDTEIEYIMPVNKVRYEIADDIKKRISVTKNSTLFEGVLKLTCAENEEKMFKLKFGAFDESDNLIVESEEYYFKIDKVKPSLNVEIRGIEENSIYNESVEIKLIAKEKQGFIYYKLKPESDWIIYEKPLVIQPPVNTKRELYIYTKFVDESGNEKEKKEPFIVKFDTTALYVDTTKKFSGNGTYNFPFNSLERAIENARKKNIKIIYLLNENIIITAPVEISSDIIIQPFYESVTPKITLETKALWRENHYWINISENGYLELRNIDFEIKSATIFCSLTKGKLKIYNCNFKYTGIDEFCFFVNNGGKIGFDNISFMNEKVIRKLTFLKSLDGTILFKNATFSFNCEEIEIFNVNKNDSFLAQKFVINANIIKKAKFALVEHSNATFENIIYNQSGDFIESSVFEINSANIFLNESDFKINGNLVFNSSFGDVKNSFFNIKKSLFELIKSTSVIGFNIENSELIFEQSLLISSFVKDYSYNFRGINSKIKLASSVLLNKEVGLSVNFLLDRSDFKVINSSIFNYKINDKAFGYWINSSSDIITVNSLYFFDRFERKNILFFLNNIEYDVFNPVWIANAVSSYVILKESVNKKEELYTIKDFTEKNIYYSFESDFDFNDKNFFVPLKDSSILQAGVTDQFSPVKIPEKDFFDRNRILSGFGIDIGAVQISGNF